MNRRVQSREQMEHAVPRDLFYAEVRYWAGRVDVHPLKVPSHGQLFLAFLQAHLDEMPSDSTL